MPRFIPNNPGFNLLYAPRERARIQAVRDRSEAVALIEAAPRVRISVLLKGTSPLEVLRSDGDGPFDIVGAWDAGPLISQTRATGVAAVTRAIYEKRLALDCRLNDPYVKGHSISVLVCQTPEGELYLTQHSAYSKGAAPMYTGSGQPTFWTPPTRISIEGASMLITDMFNVAFPRGASLPKRWGLET